MRTETHFLSSRELFCLDAISTAFLWSFVNVIYKPWHNCSLQNRLQGPAFLLRACSPCSVFNKDVAYCVFQFMLQCPGPTCCTVTNQLLLNVWCVTSEHPTPSLKTCTPHRALFQVTTDAGWIREVGWATGNQLHQFPVLTTVPCTQGFLALFRAVFTAALLGWSLASYLPV